MPVERRGGTSFETLDPDLKLAYVHELTTRLEREFSGSITVSTGVIWRGVRQQGAPSARRAGASTRSRSRRPVPTQVRPAERSDLAGDGPGILVHELPDALIESSEHHRP